MINKSFLIHFAAFAECCRYAFILPRTAACVNSVKIAHSERLISTLICHADFFSMRAAILYADKKGMTQIGEKANLTGNTHCHGSAFPCS